MSISKKVELFFENVNANNSNEDFSNAGNVFLSKTKQIGLKNTNFKTLSPIQHTSLPLGICGFDLIVKERVYSGNGVLYSIWALELVNRECEELQILILTPTKELHQLYEILMNFSKGLEGVKFLLFSDETDQVGKNTSCHIAVATPTAIKKLIDKNLINLSSLRLIVLDKAEDLINSNFTLFEQIFDKLPNEKQIVACDSYYSSNLEKFLQKIMKHPLLLSSDMDTSILLGFTQFVCLLNHEKSKSDLVIKLLKKIPFSQCLIYCKDENQAKNLTNVLRQNTWASFYIPVSLNLLEVASKLSDFKCLVSTSLIDSKQCNFDIDLVINFEIPTSSVSYIERIAKIGKTGSWGGYINLTTMDEELQRFKEIIGEIGGKEMSIPVLKLEDISEENIHSFDSSDFDNVSGIVKENNSNSELNCVMNKILKERLAKCDEDNVARKLNNLHVVQNKNDFVRIDVKEQDLEQLPQLKTLVEIYSSAVSQEQKVEEPTKENKTKNLLDLLISGKDVPHIDTDDDGRSPDSIFASNIALLNVAKFATGSGNLNREESKEVLESLAGFLNLLKEEDEIAEVHKETELVDYLEDQKYVHLKDIFKTGYDFFIKPKPISKVSQEDNFKLLSDLKNTKFDNPIEPTPMNLLLENDDDQKNSKRKSKKTKKIKSDNPKRTKQTEVFHDIVAIQRQREMDFITTDINDSVPETSKKNFMEGYNFDSHQSEYAAAYNNGNSAIDQEARDYFDYYSTILWNNGLTFNDLTSFDEWFVQWQTQVRSVTGYIQERIYLEDMNNFHKN